MKYWVFRLPDLTNGNWDYAKRVGRIEVPDGTSAPSVVAKARARFDIIGSVGLSVYKTWRIEREQTSFEGAISAAYKGASW
jgi:hypothetical protein